MAEQGLSPMRDGKIHRLLAWYDRHRRDLPWRARPGEAPDPYHVWLSEIMLQQTTVATVGSYYRKFLDLWPTVEALAAAPREEVLKAWAGLGYYARARNLHACAKVVAEELGGRFPDTEEGLRALPGIGPYTAGAIAAIAFDRKASAVDGNVERVMARLYAIETPLPEAKPEIRARALALVPDRRAGDFAQALMDLGATICAPKRLNCMICPWSEDCSGRKSGIAGELPRKKEKAERPRRKGVAFWVERQDGCVLLRERPDKGLLGGMMEVPSTEWAASVARPEAAAPLAAKWTKTGKRIEHTFTHFHLELDIWSALVPADALVPDGSARWVRKSKLAGEALPSVMRKIVDQMS
ncbi:A/G-specific adenine glycosylase [Nordella sp. HKS 07]|nr:A/G-specific adenine glycosylase [Nordella sp. HKS 07]QIG52512.1 A/G-specific adenine glycosylase [Nordella sp. HKS 07]